MDTKIVKTGEGLLNIKNNEEAVSEIIKCCHGNVGLFQELTYRLCEEYQIWKTQHHRITIGTSVNVREVLRMISKEESPRYINFITNFSGETRESKFNISKWIMKYLISYQHSELSKGVHLYMIFKYIYEDSQPDDSKIVKSNILQFFSRLDKIQPIILEYSHKVLRIMDVNFIVFLSTHYTQELEEYMYEECA